MATESFVHDGEIVTLHYDLEVVQSGPVLTLLDVTASTQAAADRVPDWLIEYHAKATADTHGATYQ